MPSLPPGSVSRRRNRFRVLVVGLAVANIVAWLARTADAPRQEPARVRAGAVAIDAAAHNAGPPSADARAAPRRTEAAPVVSPGRPGTLVIVPADRGVATGQTSHRFLVEVEGGMAVDPVAFARAIERILSDPRGWTGMDHSFRRVDRTPVDFRVALASPQTTDRLCAPLQTLGIYSCYRSGRAVLNFGRWSGGAPIYGDDLASYRRYMVNHEVGHALGYGHAGCGGVGEPAPVMMQQSKGLAGCRPNPWPLAGPSP